MTLYIYEIAVGRLLPRKPLVIDLLGFQADRFVHQLNLVPPLEQDRFVQKDSA